MNKRVIWLRIIINKLGIKIKDNNEIIKIRIKMLTTSWNKRVIWPKINKLMMMLKEKIKLN